MESNDEFIDIRSIIKHCISKKKIVAIVLCISFALSLLYTFIIDRPMYRSTAKVLIDKADASIVEFVKSKDIINQINSELSINKSYGEDGITIAFDKNTRILAISAVSGNNNEAYDIVEKSQEILKAKLESVYDVKTYTIIQQANISNSAYNQNHIKDIITFIAIGVVISGVYIIFTYYFSGLTNGSIIESNGMIYLGKINKENKSNSKVISYISKSSKIIEQLKRIVSNIELNKNFKRPRTILITSPEYKVGVTYIISNLALRYAKADKKVLILDSNIKNGIQNKIFNVENDRGLTELISSDNLSVESIIDYIKPTPLNNISVLPKGNIAINEELLISENINRILNVLNNNFDIILIDGEPVLNEITSIGWSNIVDATIVVTEYAKTKLENLIKARKIIENIGGKISGVIINKAE